MALSLSLSNYTLAAVGYLNPDDVTQEQLENDYQPYAVELALRIMMGPFAATLLGISLVCCYFYPIEESDHAERLQLLAKKREQNNNNNNNNNNNSNNNNYNYNDDSMRRTHSSRNTHDWSKRESIVGAASVTHRASLYSALDDDDDDDYEVPYYDALGRD